MTEVEQLRKENAELREENKRLRYENEQLKWRLPSPVPVQRYISDEPLYPDDYDDDRDR
jgi:regulator of replication initiation timing